MEQNFNNVSLPTGATTGGLFSWANPSRITADDGSNATLAPGGSSSGFISGNSFVFNLPPEAVIDGIAVFIDGSQTSATSTLELNIAGSGIKTAVFAGVTGGATDLWGLSAITLANLAAITATVNTTTIGAAGTAAIDFLSITVYWHVDLSVAPVDVPIRVDYKVFTKDGVYLGLVPNVSSKFAFTQDKNSAGSSIVVTAGKFMEQEIVDISPILDDANNPIQTNENQDILARTTVSPFELGGSDDDAIYKNGNRIQVWVYNYWHPNGKLVFSGQVNKLSFNYGASSSVDMIVNSDGLDLSQNLVIPVSSFTLTPDVTQTDQDTFTDLFAYTEGQPAKGATSWRFIAQTFVVGSISRIGAIDLMLQGTGEVTILLSIGGTAIRLGSVTQSVNAASPTVTRIFFNMPIEVLAGGSYYFNVLLPVFNNIRIFRSSTNVYDNNYAALSESGAYIEQNYDLYFVILAAGLGNTTTTYTLQDPVTGMLSSLLQDYNIRGGIVKTRNFTPAGLSITYEFNQDTIFDAIRKVIQLSPSGFYSYIDLGTAEIDVLNVSDTADFTIVNGRDINLASFAFSIESLKNTLFFSGGDTGGGDNLYRQYIDSKSIGNFGVRSASQSDGRVILNDTANAIGQSFIIENSVETQETSITIFDDTLDMTIFTPGKTVGFKNFGAPFDDMVLQIVRREPNFADGFANLTLGRLPLALSKELQKLNRGLLTQETLSNPNSPT